MPFSKEEKAKLKAERFRAEVADGIGNEAQGENVKEEADSSTSTATGTTGSTGTDETPVGSLTPCCVPCGCTSGKMVNVLNPDDVEKVVCNNADCTHGEFMHKSCFLTWEEEVLTYLRSSGRARSWSEKQRRQNLWTKKGYDLAWKACSCQCAKGHLRKDLDWIPPKRVATESEEGNLRKQRRRKKSSDKPSIGKATTLPANAHSGSGHGRHRHASASSNENHTPPQSPVVKSDAVSSPCQSPHSSAHSLSSSCSMGVYHQQGIKASQQQHERCKRHSEGNKNEEFEWPPPRQYSSSCSDGGDNILNSASGHGGSLGLLPGQHHSQSQESAGQTQNNEMLRQNSNSSYLLQTHCKNKGQSKFDASHNMPFVHRVDLSIFFKLLPPQKCNPYHIKMDGEQGQDCDEVRGFVLGALAAHGVATMICSMCRNRLPVFDCYPLIDGTFYLTPLNYSDVNLRMVLNSRVQFLGAVCMQCLEGVKHIVCRICNSRWDGSHYQLGTVYSYDIFAASPCCPGRVSCKKCGKPVTDPTRGTHFFSDYSQNIPCPHCGILDFHFVKPLSSYEVLCQEVNTC